MESPAQDPESKSPVYDAKQGPQDAESGDIQPLLIDPAKETKLLAKLDAAFTPVIMLVYLSCFLDRSNIGNVKTAGMPEDIGASSQEFSTAVSIFYATYVAFETPWAVLLKKLTPRLLMTGLCIVWSLVTIFSGFIQNIGGLYATRLILGACEGGLFPGLNLYLTMVYRREEQAKRVSYLWVYIIEGIFSVLVAFVVWFGLPNDPSNAYFLNAEEKEMMRVRAIQRQAYMGSEEFDWNEVKLALQDPKVYLSGAIQFCQDILLYGFSTFLPSIIQGMGYNTLQSQYLTIPVYIFGGIAFLSFAFVSDKLRIRGPFVLFANIFGIVGYILLLTDTPGGVKFFATFLCAVAVYNGPGLNLTWLNVNVAPHYRRATAIGFQQTIGNTAGVVAGQIYRKAPYKLGNGFSLGALCVSQLLIVGKYLYIRKCNNEKKRIASGELEDTRKVKTGDRALDFEYHL
ncbi:hypothetical protein SLS55_008860 [Diplodia seriata]|uniref:Transporter n=1 Tax=Diplodia seriata TaxID=420778 RepID=A0ABR3C754_9PEZI